MAGTRQVVLIIFIAWIFIALIFISWMVITFIASLCYLQVKKQPKKRKPKIDEQFKLKLLHHYLMNAPNLTVRDVGEGRANIKKQLKAIVMMGVRMEDKDSSSLANFDLDNIAKIFAFIGFKNQAPKQGLLHIIDMEFEGKQMSHELVKEAIPAIMLRAANIKSASQVYQPGDISIFYLCSI